ncbi:MAG: FtsX-like permease family protein, partial [Pseudoflavonifractor sp.]
HAQLAALLGGLPADAATLMGLLAQGSTGVQALTGGILGGLGAASAGLSNMSAALDAAQKQLAAGSDALSSGSAQYSEGLREYKKARLEFDDSVGKLQDAKKELDDAQAELDDGYGKLADGRRELDDGWTDLDAAKLELIDGKAELLDAEKEIADGEIEVADARKKLDDGWLEYNDGLAELADAKRKLPREIAKAQKELDDALIELNDGEIEYADGKAEADQELSDARKKLNDARREIAKIEDCEWYVLGRNTNMGYVSFQQDAERMGNLANVFPLIFFLVAALVCLTTMTRMVEEQRVQIGGMKALGYSKVAIALKYVGYGFLASFLGGVTGLAVGVFLIPSIIFTAWKILYTVGDLIVPFQPMISIVSVGAAVLCVTGTALGACFTTLASVPAELMRPRTPKPGKRVLLEHLPALWNRLTFTWKVTVRNLFRYKKRFWMTVVGIGGCTALIITGFGLRNSIYDVLDKQYDEISPYSSQVSLADDVTPDELQEISRQLDREKAVTEWTPCYTTTITAESPARTMDVALFAVEDDAAFDDFIHLRHRLDNDPVKLPDNGVVLTEKLGEMLDLKVGDSIVLDGDKRVTATIADFTENYVYHYVYLSEAYYEQLFGTPPDTNMILTQYSEDAVPGDISANLIALSGVTSVGLIQESRDTFTKSMQSVDYAVIIVTISAAALAFVVLYNLTNINITERMRELATLKVLGFYNGELSSYVYRENIFLTLFGILMGLFMGKFLHQWLVLTVEVDMVMFGRTARLSSYLYAAGLTALFSFLVNLAARKKLKKIDMVESLKTVE